MRRKITFGVFIALFLIIGTWWFIHTKKIRTPIAEGINAIPTDAALIFESKQSVATWKKLSQTNIMWEELLGTETFSELNKQGLYIDSLLELNPSIATLSEEHSIYVSAHPTSDRSYDLLFVFSLPDLTQQSGVEEFIQKINNNHSPAYTSDKNTKSCTITPPAHKPLTATLSDGVLIISANKQLAEAAVKQLHSVNTLAMDRNFNKVFTAAGKNVDANVYVNYNMLPKLFANAVSSSAKNELEQFGDFADYSGWDISIKPNSLTLNGFTYANDSIPHFLNLFNDQKPQKIEVTKIIPANTTSLIFYGISDIRSFYTKQSAYLQKENCRKKIAALETNYQTSFDGPVLSWVDNEIALVTTESTTSDLKENTFAILHSNTISEAKISLLQLTEIVNKDDALKPDTSLFMGHSIVHLPVQDLLSGLFGSLFKNVKENYFTAIDNYIVFGNSVNALQNFITSFEANKTLANDKNYQSFAENISSETNLYIYSAIARSEKIYNSILTPSLAKSMNQQLELLHKFEAVGVQFTSGNKLFYSNAFLKYNPEYKKESGTLWETRLDTTVTTKPYFVINHKTKAKEVFVQDDAYKIYLISNTGKIIWTKQLPEKIMSDIIQVDVLKNDKLQMVFNTRSSIYMFDRNGNSMKGFPIKLNSPATNAISVVDYENTREYRIFIACENKEILCYKSNGEPVEGFKTDKTKDQVFMPIQYFNSANKDHLCAIDVSGKIYILDRHGNIRVRIKDEIAQGIRNFFIESGKDYSRTYIVAADTLGNVIRVSLSGEKETTRLQDFETSPYFEYRDLNNDKTREYIFLTRTELKIFDQDKSLRFNYEFKDPISQLPLFFQFPDGTGKIGAVSETTNELFLFNENGSLFNAFPLNGRTPFSIGDLNNEGHFNLVTGSADKSIYMYQLQ